MLLEQSLHPDHLSITTRHITVNAWKRTTSRFLHCCLQVESFAVRWTKRESRRWKKFLSWWKMCTEVEVTEREPKEDATQQTCRARKESQFPELEEDLTAWITSKRREGVGVSTTVICFKAKALARENVIAADKFKASQSWCYKFLACNGFSIRPFLTHILMAEMQILAIMCETWSWDLTPEASAALKLSWAMSS